MSQKHSLLPTSAPSSNRWVVRIALGLIFWKLASTDYTALACLNGHEALFPILPFGSSAMVQSFFRLVFFHPAAVLAFQGAGLLCLAAATYRPEVRFLVLGALISPILLEWNALLFRWQLYDQDVPIALLLILLINPWIDWKRAVSRKSESNPSSDRLFLSAMVYLGGCYLLAGISKLATPGWVNHASLENIYPAVVIWEDIQLPAFLDMTAALHSRVFSAAPWLSTVFAAGTLFLECFWFAGIFSVRVRRVVGTLMFAVHGGIYLASGILFLSWAVMGLALAWSGFRRKREHNCEDRPMEEDRGNGRVSLLAAVGLPVAVLLVPHQTLDFFPFARYCQFGWTYADLNVGKVPYALGYKEKTDAGISEVKALPHGCGGFYDFRHEVLAKLEVKALVESAEGKERKGKERGEYQPSPRLDQLIRALRPRSSNRSLLGPLAHPDHQDTAFSAFDPNAIGSFHLLRVIYEIQEDRSVTMSYEDLGEYLTEASPGCRAD